MSFIVQAPGRSVKSFEEIADFIFWEIENS